MADDIRTCGDLDERLARYVDGEDSPEARRAVDSHLQACPSCTAQAQYEAEARQLVRDHRSALAGRAPDTLRARCAAAFDLPADRSPLPVSGFQLPADGQQRPASGFPEVSALRVPPSALRRWAPLSVAATLVLAVAGVFLFGLNDRVQALAASLAVDHVKCFKIAGTTGHADAHASEAAWQQDQGWPIAVPANDAARQLTLVEVRRCLSSDGRTAHMMYTWHGEPLSVYVLQGNAGRDEHEQSVRKMGQQAVIWCANERTYAVVSSNTDENLAPIVDYLRSRVK